MPSDGEQQPAGKPEYKVYRSRRGIFSRFRAPDLGGLRERARGKGDGGGGRAPERRPRPAGRDERDGRRWLRWVLIAAGAWLLLSFVAFGVSAQLQKMKLDDGAKDVLGGNPFLLADPATILVIGTDAREEGSQEPGAETRRRCLEQQARGEPPRGGCGGFRADTLMLIRAGGGHFRRLSIPRDVFAEIPGQPAQKINGAYAYGGAELQIRTVEQFFGIDIDHVVIVDFSGFKDFIDAIGGVEVDVPVKLCADINGGAGGGQGGQTLRLSRGEHTLDGQEALAYARIRQPSECPGTGRSAFSLGYSDIDRARAQQEVLNGIKERLTSPLRLPYNFIKGPIIGWTAPKAIVTDMGALTMPQLVLSTLLPGGGDTDVLCRDLRNFACEFSGGGISVPDSERRRAADRLLGN